MVKDEGDIRSRLRSAALQLFGERGYPLYPGRAELVLGSPLFPAATIERSGGRITIIAPDAVTDAPYVQSLRIDNRPSDMPWLPAGFVERGGRLDFVLGREPNRQ